MVNRRGTSHKAVGGPYLSAALFCDSILEERDGTLSAFRIIDAVTLKIPDSTPSDQALPIGVWFLLIFKSGNSPGKHEVRVDMRSPSGKTKRGEPQTYDLSPPQYGGINLRLMTTLTVKNGGVFWADAYLDGKPISHTPLNIVVERIKEGDGDLKSIKDSAKTTGGNKSRRRANAPRKLQP